MRRLGVIAALVALLIPAVARGDDYVPVAESAVAAWMPLADATWPGGPCVGREAVRIIDLPLGVRGQAYMDDACRFDIDPDTLALMPAVVCSVVVHEVGHLAGMPHSADPFNIMAPTAGRWWPPCAIAAGQQALAARITLASMFMRPDACASMNATVVACGAHVQRERNVWRPARYLVYPAGERWAVKRIKLNPTERKHR